MNTRLEEIGKFLRGNKYLVEQTDDALIITLENEIAKSKVYFQAENNGDILSIQLEPLEGDLHFDLPSTHKYLNIVLFQMLRENYVNKFGSWEYNPDIGDLRFTVEVPLADSIITQKQFILIMNMLKQTLTSQDNLMFIAKHGRSRMNEYFDEFAEFMKQKHNK